MRTFIVKSIGFAFLLLLGLFLLEKAFDRIITADNTNKLFWIFNREGLDLDFAVLGSSKTAGGVDVGTIERLSGRTGINLAVEGGRYADGFIVLEKFLEKNKIKQLLLEVNVMAFDRRTTSFSFNPYSYVPYKNDKVIREVLKDHFSLLYWWIWNYIPFAPYIEHNHQVGLKNLYGILTKRKSYFDEKGTAFPRGPSSFYDLEFGDFRVEERDVRYFRKIIVLAQQRGIEVVFFMPPEYKEYDRFMTTRSAVMSFIARNAEYYKVRYYNFDDNDIRSNKALFRDFSHLNKQGAILFSSSLAHSVFSKEVKQGLAYRKLN